ncbi:ABC transporter permease [Dactylosporangium sp. NBC_01737]|uniref:ABC transporter permease n=1 Tax=Dactylosporangium sp. NBC_01737 TaxID=2975959 RepID=UPI002E14FF2D|nr:ABC transporter permease [Dactylosporangium sp. NBC_01737]
MTTAELSPARLAPSRDRSGAGTTAALTLHALRAFTRSPMSAFFTVAFPLSFFLIVNTIVGDAPVDQDGAVRVSQFLVAPFAVFGTVEAVFCVLAIDLAVLREGGVLKRLRGSPVPAWSVLAARVCAAVLVALSSVALLVAVGVLAYDVQIVWRKVPAAVVALLVGVACFAALGLALVGLTRSVLAAQTLSNGLLIPLAFVSNVFIVGADLPAPLAWAGRVLPLRHFADAVATTFDPAAAGSGFRPADLAVMAAWGAAGAVVAVRWFGWEPRRGAHTPQARHGVAAATGAAYGLTAAVVRPVEPGPARMVGVQARAAFIAMRRDTLAVFFAAVFPVLLLLLFPAVFPDAGFEGVPLGEFMVPSMIAYSIAVATYVNLPAAVAQARDHGVLDRLRGSPAPLWTFYAGRAVAAAVTAAGTAVLLVAAGALANGYRPDPARLPAAVLAFTAGVACCSALGFALAASLRAGQYVPAVALGTLLPLSFISDVFVVGNGGPLPAALRYTADVFPLKHLSRAMLDALGPDGGGVAWTHLGVLAVWTLAGVLVAARSRAAGTTD